MKTNYTGQLRCATCGCDSEFTFNDDKSYVKCERCGREYHGGYNEVLSYNTSEIERVKQQIAEDVKKEFANILKK
jgi:hypothetical protein